MPYIDDITVNGQQTDEDTTPTVGTLYPIILWDYVSETTEFGQLKFEIRIDTQNTNIGTDNFDGGITTESSDSSANRFEISSNILSRGVIYYGQVRAIDQNNTPSEWSQFSFKTNRLPTIPSLSLSPSSPSVGDNIDLIYMYLDADQHEESGTKIRWFKNNIPQLEYDNLCTLPNTALSPGDSWSAKIIPSDGLEFGATFETTAVTVSEVESVVGNINIFPVDANVDDILKVEYELTDNEYEYISTTGTTVIEWYLNNKAVQDSNQQYIRLKLSPDDVVFVKIKIVDGETTLSESRSSDLIIQDVSWTIFDLRVDGVIDPFNLVGLTPFLEWNIHKSTAGSNEFPSYLSVLVTKTISLSGSIYSSGALPYVRNSFTIPDGVFERGQRYFIHVGAGDDEDISHDQYITQEISFAGSSWAENVDNDRGWTVEFKMSPGAKSQDLATEESVPLLNVVSPSPYNRTFTPASGSGLVTVTITASLTDSRPTFSVTSGSSTLLNIPLSSVNSNVATGSFTPGSVTELTISGAEGSDAVSSSYQIIITQQLSSPVVATSNVNMGIYIHDGAYFRAVTIGPRYVLLLSGEATRYTLPSSEPDFIYARTFKISGKLKDTKIYINNKLVINATGTATNESNIKMIEFGDIDSKQVNSGTFRFIRYSTLGAYGFENSLSDTNTYYFSKIGHFAGGSIQYIYDNLVSWLPDTEMASSSLIKFNENSQTSVLQTVNRNFSPITCLYIDEKRNKYLGTANGVTVIYGDKHDPDYIFDTSGSSISSEDFDRISNVLAANLSAVEAKTKQGWFSIDTTYRTAGAIVTSETDDPYDPYLTQQQTHVIHYYSQRTHGHPWYDDVDNTKGWQVSFSFKLDILEADIFSEENLIKSGFGVYVNDGHYQEIIYFYDDRIRLFYANVYVPIVTTVEREYSICGKDSNIWIYQRLLSSASGGFQLVLDGSGLFNTTSSDGGNSTNTRCVIDSTGNYHTVWQDSTKTRSRIMYSNFDGNIWSAQESITNDTLTQTSDVRFSLNNPALDVDSRNRTWVVYEDTSWGQTEISVSVRDSAGWNPRTRVTNYKSTKRNPDIKIDHLDNVHVVWEDNRDGLWKIFWAYWDNQKQAWISSGQFGEDTIVLQETDPYSAINYRNARLAYARPYLWMTAEGEFSETNESRIYLSSRDVILGVWNSAGALIFDDDGNVTSTGTSILVSSTNRLCRRPVIAASKTYNTIVIAWEDLTDSVTQIWSAAFSTRGITIQEATKITNQSESCIRPTAGFVSNQCVIVFEKNNHLYLCSYNTSDQDFFGSNLSATDRPIETSSTKRAYRPSVPPIVASKLFKVFYDYTTERDVSALDSIEAPEFHLVGSTDVEHKEVSENSVTTTTSTIGDANVSGIDTKEFAFGDFSDNVGLKARWKNIKMFFGYDARPHSISKFNTKTVLKWPDNRVNDIFVDIYGNIIAATFGGLIYHNVFTADSTVIDGHTSDFDPTKRCSDTENDGKCLLRGKLTTAVKWGRNGVWYVGTTQGVFYSNTAGRVWSPLFSSETGNKVINAIAVNDGGQAVIAAVKMSNSQIAESVIYVAHPSMATPIKIAMPVTNIRSVSVDASNIIWVGSDTGLFRIENFTSIMKFDASSGMKSSHVNDIAVVNKHLRFIATATGIERMYGTKFSNLNTNTHDLTSNNISRILWHTPTNSLWAASMYALHEISFRDPFHEIISDEITVYDTSEISTEEFYDKNIYYLLDYDKIQSDPSNPILFNTETASVLVNKNPIDFGYSIDESAQTIVFLTDMLIDDQVEVKISDKFIKFHSFEQTDIEKSVRGKKSQSITKMTRTSKNQLLLLSSLDKPSLLLFAEDESNLPFTTILLDRDLPQGCLEKVETLTRTKIRFRIVAFDEMSGLDSYILSNYENFTSDGTTPLNYKPIQTFVEHDIGSSLTNVFDSLVIPSTVEINSQTYNVGTGSKICTWTNLDTNTIHLIAGTSAPAVIFIFDPVLSVWTGVAAIDQIDSQRHINDMKNINNIIFVTTGTTSTGGFGAIYKSADGVNYDLVSAISGTDARGIAGSIDGSVYFGDDNGTIYIYKNNVLEVKYENIGQSIHSLDIFNDTLIVTTGNMGRVYTIELTTGNNLIVFDGPEGFINTSHVFSDAAVDPLKSKLFISANSSSTIYVSDLENFDFSKSYNSFNKNINRISTVGTTAIVESGTAVDTQFTVLASIGSALFKNNGTTWEFMYNHDEEIVDFVQYESNGVDGIWLISETKITKWTAVLSKKTVFLRLKDKAGNISRTPLIGDEYVCPTENSTFCCDYAYSINIRDLKNFVNESRIVTISEYGEIVFTYDSPNTNLFYSGDLIDEDIGIYTSEVLNGSNDLVSWKSVSWNATEPEGTEVNMQIRSGKTEDLALDAEWSADLIPDAFDSVSIEHITDQYLQFRVRLSSTVRDVSPTLTSVTVRNLTAETSHFFTTNFVLPSRPIKGLLTANTFLPVSADVVFGISSNDSVDFGDYQIIEPNRLFTTTLGQFGTNFRIGAKLLSPGLPTTFATNNDPYDDAYLCIVSFNYENETSGSLNYHFRVKFFSDVFRTRLEYTFFTGNDQTGWAVSSGPDGMFPSAGVDLDASESVAVTFTPDSLVTQNQRWYLIIDAFNGTDFETISDDRSFVCFTCNVSREAGLVGNYYQSTVALSALPIFSETTLLPAIQSVDTNIDFTLINTQWVTSSGTATGLLDNFAIRWKGQIEIAMAGSYQFTLSSKDGSKLYINRELIVDNNGTHDLQSESSSVDLTEGFHDIEVQFFSATGYAGIQLKWRLPGSNHDIVVPASVLFHAVTDEYCEITAPRILNFAIQFELENGESVKLNLS